MTSHALSVEEPFSKSPDSPDPTSPLECWLAAGLLGLGSLLRLLYIWHYRVDSDEPQHLHVVWAWTQGLLPYRDVFDNHSPLFQALYAPLFHLLGVRADILLPMRAAELPLYAATIFAVWRIAVALYSPRTALWTAVLAALCPPLGFADGFYCSSLEFRPDQLWALLWMLILLVLVKGRATPGRAFLAGVLCGVAFSVSMKTTLLLATLAPGVIGALFLRRAVGGLHLGWSRLLRCAGAGLAGIPLVPGLVVLYFCTHGSAQQLYECVITHNILPGSTAHGLSNGTIKCCLCGLAAAVAGGLLISRLGKPIAVRTRIGLVYFAGLLYLTILKAFWPVITEEDYLPFYPVMILTAGPATLWLVAFLVRNASLPGPLLAGAEMFGILAAVSPFQDNTGDKIGIVADALKLTTPDDFVMDSKGETIYRNRPYRYVLESRTVHRMKMGALRDVIARELVRTRTPLATTTRMPHRARDFIKTNYVPIAFRLRVLGKVVYKASTALSKSCVFRVTVPQCYTLITPSGLPAGDLDGTPFTGPRELAAGNHVFLLESNAEEVVLIWAPALDRGYSPFAKIKEDHTTPQD